MGSLALTSFSPGKRPSDAVTRPPELSDAEYVRSVLKQPTSLTEDEMEKELLATAARLGIDISTTIISTSRPSTPSDKPTTPDANASPMRHVRTSSTASNESGSTGRTVVYHLNSSPSVFADLSVSPIGGMMITRKRSKSLSFSQYEKYLNQVDPNLTQPRLVAHQRTHTETVSVFGGESGARRSVKGIIKRGIAERLRLRRRATIGGSGGAMYCICCREDFTTTTSLHTLQTLPCGHTYCPVCLTIMITQSMTDESKMPPRCCTQPIPGSVIKSILPREEQQSFLKAVLQFSVPWESRVFCPSASCGEFIPPRSKIEPKHPFDVVCRRCKTRVCVMCKRDAHGTGQDCPSDWELDAVLKMGEKSGWRRCYKCRTLVELTQGCTHMTCRCKAQFCYICGAVWDPVVGCPNFCNGEEELERRRVEEEARAAEVEAEKMLMEEAAAAEEAERVRAAERTAGCEECGELREGWKLQMGEFRRFEHKMKWIMWTRHSQKRLAIIDKYRDAIEKMKERHAKTEQHLEDRQIEAEIELRSSLDQSEKSIRIQLKYMEAYCNVLGRPGDGEMPEREVTQRHLQQLGQQYHIRDGMERRNQSQINVLREKQAKRMEELAERHVKEMGALMERRMSEFEDLGLEFADEEEALVRVFGERKARMRRRWVLEGKILRREMEARDGVGYGPVEGPEWPSDGEGQDGDLPSVREEDALSE